MFNVKVDLVGDLGTLDSLSRLGQIGKDDSEDQKKADGGALDSGHFQSWLVTNGGEAMEKRSELGPEAEGFKWR